MKRIGQKNKLSVGWRNNKMISAKEDMKNAITLEEKRYDSNSLIEDTWTGRHIGFSIGICRQVFVLRKA